jgi:hypothetical protein
MSKEKVNMEMECEEEETFSWVRSFLTKDDGSVKTSKK